MKLKLTILFALISAVCFGQVDTVTRSGVYQSMPQNGYGPVKRMQIDSVLTLPEGITALRNLVNGRNRGQVRYNAADSSVYVWTGSQFLKVTGSSGGGSVDSVTVSNDSLFYWTGGTETFVTNLAVSAAGGDTTIYENVIDTTGQTNQRVLYAKNRKISSDPTFIFNEATKILTADSIATQTIRLVNPDDINSIESVDGRLDFKARDYGSTVRLDLENDNDVAFQAKDSIDTPANMVWQDNLGRLHKAAVPSGADSTLFATQYDLEGYIPLSGTVAGKPVTGDIEIINGVAIKSPNVFLDGYNLLSIDDVTVGFQVTGGGANTSLSANSSEITIGSNNAASKGLLGGSDFSANYDDLTYVQKIYVDRKADSLRGEIADSMATTLQSVVAGTNVTVDNTDPRNPVISATGGGGGSYTDSLTQIGQLYSKRSWAALTDFNDVGTGATISGTDINITGGTNVFTEYLSIKDTTMDADFKYRVRFKVNAAPAANDGLGIGIKGVFSDLARADLSNGVNAGKILLYRQGVALTGAIYGGTAISFAQNDSLELTYEKTGMVVTASLYNLNNGAAPYSATYYYQPIITSVPFPSVGSFSIFRFGGNYNINAINVKSTERKYAKYAFLGDSKTQFFSATDLSKGFVDIVNQYVKSDKNALSSVVNYGAGSSTTSWALGQVDNIIAAKPTIVFMAIGSNDKRIGVSNATWFTNYKSITSQLVAAGITVKHLLPFPEDALNFSDYVDSIITTYPADYIDTWNPLRTGTALNNTYDGGDGVHPNDAGHQLIARQIIKTGLLDIYEPIKSKTYWDVDHGGGNIATNTVYGVNNLFANATGLQNTAIGYGVFPSTTSSFNTGVGYWAGNVNTTGNYITAIGTNSLKANTTGVENTGVGVNTLFNNVSGGKNSALGVGALQNNTVSNNSGFGFGVLKTNSTGTDNAAFGYNALTLSTTGTNAAFGSQALSTATTGSQNTGVGFGAIGQNLTHTGSRNTGVGSLVLRNNGSGNDNTAIGINSLLNSTVSNGAAFGAYSGKYITTQASVLVLNSLDRTNLAGDSTASPIWINQSTTLGQQNGRINARLGINTTPDASAALDVSSTTGGLKLPVMTAAQASAIASPANGLLVYVTDTDATFTSIGFWGRLNGTWTALHL